LGTRTFQIPYEKLKKVTELLSQYNRPLSNNKTLKTFLFLNKKPHDFFIVGALSKMFLFCIIEYNAHLQNLYFLNFYLSLK